MQNDDLKPCPFCGGEAVRITLGEDEPNNAGGDVITCTCCQASSHVEFGRKENLVDRWNTRTAPSGEGRSNGAGEEPLERWSDISGNASAIVACGDRWRAIAEKIGCALHGFNDGFSASFISPDGTVFEVGPKFRETIAALSAPQGEVERLRELLTIAVDEHDNHQGKATLPCHWTNHARTLLGGADDAR